MIGKRIEMLVVIERLPGSKVRCLCDCGEEKILNIGHFNTGKMKSCGCHVGRHGHSGGRNNTRTATYTSYWNMIARCHNVKNKRFKDYGAKGILVCDRWRHSFKNFLDDIGECPIGFTIDRIDNTKGYSPENCRWVSRSENQCNRSVSRIYILFGKEYKSSTEAAFDLGVSTASIMSWCLGRKVGEKLYPPKEGCSARNLY